MNKRVFSFLGLLFLSLLVAVVVLTYSDTTISGFFVLNSTNDQVLTAPSGTLGETSFWLWIIIAFLGLLMFIGVIILVYVLYSQSARAQRLTVEKPSWHVDGKLPISSGVPPIAYKKQQGIVEEHPASSVSRAQSLNSTPRVASSMNFSSLPERLRYVWYYAQGMSQSSKVRIRYLLSVGDELLADGNLEHAKIVYRFIFDEYAFIKEQDDSLYHDIISFKNKLS